MICLYQNNKIAVEVNEYSQSDRDNNYKTKGEEILKKKTGWVCIRINPYEQSFNNFNDMNIINRQITKENKKISQKKD